MGIDLCPSEPVSTRMSADSSECMRIKTSPRELCARAYVEAHFAAPIRLIRLRRAMPRVSVRCNAYVRQRTDIEGRHGHAHCWSGSVDCTGSGTLLPRGP